MCARPRPLDWHLRDLQALLFGHGKGKAILAGGHWSPGDQIAGIGEMHTEEGAEIGVFALAGPDP